MKIVNEEQLRTEIEVKLGKIHSKVFQAPPPPPCHTNSPQGPSHNAWANNNAADYLFQKRAPDINALLNDFKAQILSSIKIQLGDIIQKISINSAKIDSILHI